MGTTERLLQAVKDALVLSEEVKRLSRQVEKLADHTLDLDRRLVRVETAIDIAKLARALPKS